MDLDMHQAIAGKLEAGKTGRLAVGISRGLAWAERPASQPEVTVWRSSDQNDDTIRAYLSGLLSDLVSVREIIIADG